MPFDHWPAADKTSWGFLSRQGEAWEPAGRGTVWTPKTLNMVMEGYGAWLRWLSEHERNTLFVDPLERITRDRVRSYCDAIGKQLAPPTAQMRLQRLGQAATGFSESAEFRWIFRAANRLKPVSTKNKRARMQPAHKVAELGFALMEEAKGGGGSRYSPWTVRFRDGLIIVLLTYSALRRANIAGIRVGQNLISENGSYVLRFSETETKQHAEMEFRVPAAIVPYLNTYLSEIRPRLRGTKNICADALWVSLDGGPLTHESFTDLVLKRTADAFGNSINPHLIRDIAATTIALDKPEQAAAIAGVLGHSSMATSEKHYNQARMLEAGSEYHRILEGRRRRRSALRPNHSTGLYC